MRTQISMILFMAAAACGGSQKTGGGEGGPHNGVAAAPTIAKEAPTVQNGTAPPKVEVSTDERKDFQDAAQFFATTDKAGKWDESACKSAADKFQSVVSSHPKLVAAQVMVGTSYSRCGMWGDAEKAYEQAMRMPGDPLKSAQAESNLGEIYFMQGKADAAKDYWTKASTANGKLVGAQIGLASLEIAEMHKINNPKDAHWKELETDAKFKLSSALGVESDSVAAYTAYGKLYMEGWQQNKNRLDLAKLLLDEGKQRNEKYPDLQNAYGLYWMHRGSLNQALASFSAAVDADPKFVEARINAGLLTLNFRKYDMAKEMFSKALEVQPKNYTAIIGLGVAMRGLGDLDGAEKQYKLAEQVNPSAGAAYFNMGVLYKDFRATKTNDPDPIKALQASQGVYRQAREFFQQFMDKDSSAGDKQEAKNNIADCDKVVKQLDSAITSLKNAPPPPPTAPAPPPAGAGSAAPPASK